MWKHMDLCWVLKLMLKCNILHDYKENDWIGSQLGKMTHSSLCMFVLAKGLCVSVPTTSARCVWPKLQSRCEATLETPTCRYLPSRCETQQARWPLTPTASGGAKEAKRRIYRMFVSNLTCFCCSETHSWYKWSLYLTPQVLKTQQELIYLMPDLLKAYEKFKKKIIWKNSKKKRKNVVKCQN